MLLNIVVRLSVERFPGCVAKGPGEKCEGRSHGPKSFDGKARLGNAREDGHKEDTRPSGRGRDYLHRGKLSRLEKKGFST